jgi:hypothetical protein
VKLSISGKDKLTHHEAWPHTRPACRPGLLVLRDGFDCRDEVLVKVAELKIDARLPMYALEADLLLRSQHHEAARRVVAAVVAQSPAFWPRGRKEERGTPPSGCSVCSVGGSARPGSAASHPRRATRHKRLSRNARQPDKASDIPTVPTTQGYAGAQRHACPAFAAYEPVELQPAQRHVPCSVCTHKERSTEDRRFDRTRGLAGDGDRASPDSS